MCYIPCTYQKNNISMPNFSNSVLMGNFYMQKDVLKKIANLFFGQTQTRGDLVIKRYYERPRSDFYIRGAEIGRIDNALIRAFPEVVSLNGAYLLMDCERQRERFIKNMTIKAIGGIMENIVQTFFPKFNEATIFAFNSENPEEGIIYIPEMKVDDWMRQSMIRITEIVEDERK